MISFVKTQENCVYLTFDDGPEPGITEFVLDELNKYGYKATFFCRGDNAQKYPELLQRIKEEGHTIGNHTYSHLHTFNSNAIDYYNDVEKANLLLGTSLFRPPYGSFTLSTFLRLKNKYRLFYWSLNSGDSDMEKYDYNRRINVLKSRTQAGDIVLFHFCLMHEKETCELLPVYLKWLNDKLYFSSKLEL